MNQPACLGEPHEFRRLRRGRRERFLAHDMLAGGQRRRGLRVMQTIGRGDMDHVDPRVGQHGLEARIRGRQAEGSRAFRGPRMARTDDTVHLHAEPPQRLDVHRPDKAGPDDRSPDVADRSRGLRLHTTSSLRG